MLIGAASLVSENNSIVSPASLMPAMFMVLMISHPPNLELVKMVNYGSTAMSDRLVINNMMVNMLIDETTERMKTFRTFIVLFII